jgi:hypothetical protein
VLSHDCESCSHDTNSVNTALAVAAVTQILQGEGRIDPQEWRFLIAGSAPPPAAGSALLQNPDLSWIEANVWGELSALARLPYFKGCTDAFAARKGEWRRVFDSATPQSAAFPAPFGDMPRKPAAAADSSEFGELQ